MRLLVLVHALVLVICIAGAGPTEDRTQFPPTYMPSGEQMYKQYCAACKVSSPYAIAAPSVGCGSSIGSQPMLIGH